MKKVIPVLLMTLTGLFLSGTVYANEESVDISCEQQAIDSGIENEEDLQAFLAECETYNSGSEELPEEMSEDLSVTTE